MISVYYDVDAILAEEERVPVVFRTESKGLGGLSAASLTVDLDAGSRVDLPLWLAPALAERLWVSIKAPKCFAKRFRNFLLSDPTVVNLREKSPNYYETGRRLVAFVDGNQQLHSALVKTLAVRYKEILDRSQHSRNEDLSKVTAGMTELEKKLFYAGYNGKDELFHWKRREPLQATQRGLKRKLRDPS